MKYLKLLFAAAAIIGLAACKNEVPDPGQGEDGNTYAYVTLTTPNDFRAENDDFNKVGEWDGKDKFETVNIYLLDVASGAITKAAYTQIDFDITQGTTGTTMAPKKAIKTSAGNKVVYAVINAPAALVAEFDAAVTKTAFDKLISDPYAGLSASEVAKAEADHDVILMTSIHKPNDLPFTVVEGVSEADALAGPLIVRR